MLAPFLAKFWQKSCLISGRVLIRFKGGGGGVHPDYFVKLDFEIAVDQQTRARDRNFEVVPDSGCPPVPAGQPRPYLVNLRPNFAK